MSEATEDTLAGDPRELGADVSAGGRLASSPSLDATLPSGRYAIDGTGAPASARAPAATGTIIGRYVVIAKLGAGAMGVVLSAYDPELDRKVAIKLLKLRGGDQGVARARLKREAQALAKLAHPNVVGVHDVGDHEGELFVAMEFVEGQDLGEWMKSVDTPRPWREVVSVFSAAGRGLAAAHGVGLVHRDFKPDNVMLGEDRRVRVMDFGLARTSIAGEAEVASRRQDPTQLPAALLLNSRMTHTGALLGTPAYMAYELFEGAQADARSDQFGFCVALYEALYGARPFSGDNVGQLILALKCAEIPEPPAGSSVPSWLRKVVVRGLADAPEQRHASMQDLLDALANDPAIRRRRWAVGALVVAALGAGTWGATRGAEPELASCSGSEAKLAGVWDATRRAEVEAALVATGLSYAAQTGALVSERLQSYTQAWVSMRTEACEATERGEQSAAMLDARMACLDERLSQVATTVEILAAADETVVNKAVDAASGLPSLARCADLDALTAAVAPPEDPQVAAGVEQQDEVLTRAAVLRRHGRFEDSLALVEGAAAEAETLGYAPLRARAALLLGGIQRDLGSYEASEAAFVEAYQLAITQQMPAEAAEASAELMFVVGERLRRRADGRRWALDARPFAEAAGSDEAWGLYSVNLGALAVTEGSYEEARVAFEAAVEAWTSAYGPEHARVGASLSNLGIVAARQGKRSEARAYYERALAIREQALGPNHPALGPSLSNLGSLARSEGDYADARRYLERALEIGLAALGPDHPEPAYALNNLGSVALDEKNYAEARERFEATHANWTETLGPTHPNTLLVTGNLGDVALAQGRHAEALEIFESLLPTVAQTLGQDHVLLPYALLGAGAALVELERPAEALVYLERALALPGALEGNVELLVDLRFMLARALWDADTAAGGDHDRALELAQLAREACVAAGQGQADALAELDSWLAPRR